MERKYRTVSVLTPVILEIDEIINELKKWNSRSDFIHEALREKIRRERTHNTLSKELEQIMEAPT